ncbi:putative type VI secretion system effector [Variovorax rhizosphaerae]|uniref:Type VI secretion system effector n=1 Tax=Variovorax rhizosphaerae TaxID=1836200 RepID=A0ABU8WHU6_9BURK
MTASNHPNGLVKLFGKIKNYKVTRTEASFVFTDADRTRLGVIAVAAGIVGLSGPAISAASSAVGAEELADYVEFNLHESSVKGWVWRSPFKEGDLVEIVAEWQGDHYEAIGIARPVDRIIAMYPHCSRGRSTHVRNALKWWIFSVTALLGLGSIFFWVGLGADQMHVFFTRIFPFVGLGSYTFFGLMTISLARRWMPFVRLAQKVFVTLDWADPGNIDLVRSSKIKRKLDDPGEFGTFYFRY